MNRALRLADRKCQMCGKPMARACRQTWAQYDRRRFCSNVCTGMSQRLEPRARKRHDLGTRNCEHCGKPFERGKREKTQDFLARRGCSAACSSELRRVSVSSGVRSVRETGKARPTELREWPANIRFLDDPAARRDAGSGYMPSRAPILERSAAC